MKKRQPLYIGLLLLVSSLAVAQTRVNVAHLAPFADTLGGTAVSVEVNGNQVLTGFQFKDVSGYVELSGAGMAPGSTDLGVFAPPGADEPAIAATVDLDADTDYTVAAIGDGANQQLALFPLVDDNSAPGAGNVKVRVFHAAPFADTLEATAVSIRLDSGDVVNNLNSVEYAQSSGYFELPADTYDLQVASVDGSATFIDLAPVTLPEGAIVTIFAIGDGVNQPLGALAVFGDGSSLRLPLETDFSGINAGLNGAWASSDTNSQGFMIEVLSEREEIFLAWFTYDTTPPLDSATAVVGAPGQRWYSAQGAYSGGSATLDMVLSSNGIFTSAAEADILADGQVGTINIRFISCSEAELSYNLLSSGLSGTLSLQRIASDNVAVCEALAVTE